MPIRELSIDAIELADSAQPRQFVDMDTVADYAEALRAGDVFPPVVVFGKFLGDGFHRYFAHQSSSLKKIRADVREGGRREAILYSCGANAKHGLRRSNADKRRAVLKLLEDPEWQGWSDRRIARVAAVSHTFVRDLRRDLSVNGLQIAGDRKVERGGTVYTQKTAPIGRNRRATAKPGLPPDAASSSSVPSMETLARALDLINGLRVDASAVPIDDSLRAKFRHAHGWLTAYGVHHHVTL